MLLNCNSATSQRGTRTTTAKFLYCYLKLKGCYCIFSLGTFLEPLAHCTDLTRQLRNSLVKCKSIFWLDVVLGVVRVAIVLAFKLSVYLPNLSFISKMLAFVTCTILSRRPSLISFKLSVQSVFFLSLTFGNLILLLRTFRSMFIFVQFQNCYCQLPWCKFEQENVAYL